MFITSGSENESKNFLLGQGDFEITNSIRFRSGVTAYLGRTPATASSGTKWTFSCWVKRGTFGIANRLINAGQSGVADDGIFFNATDNLSVLINNGITIGTITTIACFRDPGSWYHICGSVDTTLSISTNRVILYVNGIRQTLTGTYPTQNFSCTGMNQLKPHFIGRWYGGSNDLDGYLSEVNFIDGLALTPSSFGYIRPETGQWRPIPYDGSYGLNGFYLPFTDGTSTASLGYDNAPISGTHTTANNWTVNGISLVAGSTYDWMLDSPTNNYSVLNSITSLVAGTVFSDGNLTWANSAATSNQAKSTFTDIVLPSKYYFEAILANIGGGSTFTYAGVNSTYYLTNGQIYNGATLLTSVATYTTGDCVSFAVSSTGTTVYKNGVVVYISTISGNAPLCNGFGGCKWSLNFGQQPFRYPTLSDFGSLCVKNLLDPSILRPEKYFNAKTYIGSGSNLQVGEIQKPVDLITIGQSLRFNSISSQYLSRAVSTTTSRTTWTWSAWVKKSSLTTSTASAAMALFSVGDGSSSNHTSIRIGNSAFTGYNALELTTVSGAVVTSRIVTSTQYEDVSSFVHIVVVYDSNNVIANDRLRLYSNGVRIVSSQLAYLTLPALSAESCVNYAYGGQGHRIGKSSYSISENFDGYMANIYFIDGLPLTADSFGQFDIGGYWIPNTYTGSYGVNGFHLAFSDSTSLVTLGKDTSGNNNNWTATSFSILAGSTHSQVLDSPTNNYCILDVNKIALGASTAFVLSNGNLIVSLSGSGNLSTIGSSFSFPTEGKLYSEFVFTNIGSSPNSTGIQIGNTGYRADGTYNGTNAYGAVYTTGDLISTAIDLDNMQVTYYKNNVSQGIQKITSGSYIQLVLGGATSPVISCNFGQQSFTYTPPVGFVSFCENNVKEYTFDIEKPDLTWIKSRTDTTSNMIYDSVRTTTPYLLHYVPGTYSYTVPPGVTSISVIVRGGGGGGGGGAANGGDGWASGGGGSGYVTETTLTVTPGTIYTIVVGIGGTGGTSSFGGTGATGATGGTSSFGTTSALGGAGGTGAATNAYAARAGGAGGFAGTAGYTIFSEYYLGGCGGGTGAAGYIVVANSAACQASKGGDSAKGYTGASNTYAYIGQFTAYYGFGGGGAGDLGNANGINGGLGGGGGAGIYGGQTGGSGNSGYVIVVDGQQYVNYNAISSNTYALEKFTPGLTGVTALYKNGFSLGDNTSVNNKNSSYVVWNWKKGSLPGVDIVKYTGTGTNAPIAHDLKSPPSMIIVKKLVGTTGTGISDPVVYHNKLTASNILYLNSEVSQSVNATCFNAVPTSTSFNVGSNTLVNEANATFISYLFAEVPGFSKFGTYTGNGIIDGPFVSCGFKPAFVMFKRIDAPGGGWSIIDSTRGSTNVISTLLYPSDTRSEQVVTDDNTDFVSTGFKLRGTGVNGQNLLNGTYIYAAFAENTFKYSNSK